MTWLPVSELSVYRICVSVWVLKVVMYAIGFIKYNQMVYNIT